MERQAVSVGWGSREEIFTAGVLMLSRNWAVGGHRAHECVHPGRAAEPLCQCKCVSPGMGLSLLLSPLAVQDLQAFEMQD